MDLGKRLLLVIVTASTIVEGLHRDYKLILQDADIGTMDKNVLDESSYLEIAEKDNQPVGNGMIEFKQDLPPETIIWWEVFTKNENNEEALKSTGPKTTLCRFLKEQKPIADMVLNHSNLPAECPYLKGKFDIKDAVVNEEVFPAKIPKDQYFFKLRMNLVNDSKPILMFWVDCFVKWSE